MKICIKKEPSVAAVTDRYLDIIGDALESLGFPVLREYDWDRLPMEKGDLAVTATATGAARLAAKGRPYLYWAQGLWPEESRMRHGSAPRFWLTSRLEKQALKKARFVFFVSRAMKQHYEKKYGLSFEGRHYIMPCFNDTLHPESFDAPGKYASPTFCYAGSLSPWQCFEETAALYRRIEERLPGAKLLVLVKDHAAARQILEKHGVRNYELDFVPPKWLPQRLAGIRFGFLLRRDEDVNRVATPTKLVSYLSAGLIPIYSSCLTGVTELLEGTAFSIACDDTGDPSSFLHRLTSPVDAKEVQRDFASIFEKHYHSPTHTRQIAAAVKTRLE